MFLKSENDSSITIKNAWICKGLFHNLLSVRKLEEAGFMVLFKNKKVEIIKKGKVMLNGQFGTQIERLRCDNGGEYSSSDFKDFCIQNGIKCQYTIPRNPEQNGIAERYNRTVMEKARCPILTLNWINLFGEKQ